MSISTPLTALLGITHPILSAPMDVIAGARLTEAVSAAGGFGILGGGYGDKAWLEQETAKLKSVSAPFGIGFITWSLAKRPELLDVALALRPRAIMLSFGDPKPFAGRIKSSGALLICQVQDEGMARMALDAGADLLIAQGSEAGGHGASRTTIDIVPAIVDLVAGRVPVAAAGGLGDGRGLAAMMMLGASGVLLGTRFVATQEALASSVAKAKIVDASGDATLRTRVFDIVRGIEWPAPYTGRALQNQFTQRWHGRERELQQALALEAPLYAEATRAEQFETALIWSGEGCDLIHDVPPAGELVRRIVAEARATLAHVAPS